MSLNNVELDTRKTAINPKGRGGWVAVAVALIMTWEGYAAVGHHDPIDPPGVNTIGYGHIEDVHIGDRVTKIQAGEILAKDLPRYEAQVEKCIHVPMPGYRHAAILSFDYNVGGGALCRSSVARYINAGDWQRGCDALLLYNKANHRYIQGLENRRQAERKLCYNTNEPPIPDEEVLANGQKSGEGDVVIPWKGASPAPAAAPSVSWWERIRSWPWSTK